MKPPIASGDEPCREDPDAWFPEKSHQATEAKRLCQGCDIVAACAEYGIRHEANGGIWGGLSEDDRRAIRKMRGIAVQTPHVGLARSYRAAAS